MTKKPLHLKGTYFNIKIDLVFKLYFQKNTKVLISLLKSFFPDLKKANIKDLHILPPSYLETPTHKQPILDLSLLLENGSKVNVEMQILPEASFFNRVIFYWSKMYGSSLKRGQKYNLLKPVYSLIITDFPVFPQVSSYVNAFSIRSDRSPYFPLNNHLQMVFVELSKFKGKVKNLVDIQDLWCYLIKKSGSMTEEEARVLKTKGEDMRRAMEHLEIMSKEEEAQFIEDMRMKEAWKKQAQLDYQFNEGLKQGQQRGIAKGKQEGIKQGEQRGIAKGMKQGEQRGIAKGMKQGEQRGIAKGKQEGKQEGIRQTALNMLSKNMDIKQIAELTELSMEEIQDLKSSLN